MKFVYATPIEAIGEIADTVTEAMSYGSVLLLVSGGSNIDTAVAVRRKLKLTNHVSVGLIDERYGPVNHADSNWTQLIDAGFETRHIHLLPVITNDDPISEASAHYQERLRKAISDHDTVIGIFGIGTDGHTAGILPNSPAIDSHELVTYFNGPDFPRITITPASMKLFNHAFLVSYNENKHDQLRRLQTELPISKQPAQALKEISNLIILTDFQGMAQS